MHRRRAQALWGAAMAAAAVAGGLMFFIDPATASIYPKCPFYALTHLYCPGCGSLRAVHQLLHGRALAAMHLNPFTVMCLPVLAYAAVSYTRVALGRRAWPSRVIPAVWVRLLAGALVVFWVVRNLPGEPWSWLAPPRMAAGESNRR